MFILIAPPPSLAVRLRLFTVFSRTHGTCPCGSLQRDGSFVITEEPCVTDTLKALVYTFNKIWLDDHQAIVKAYPRLEEEDGSLMKAAEET